MAFNPTIIGPGNQTAPQNVAWPINPGTYSTVNGTNWNVGMTFGDGIAITLPLPIGATGSTGNAIPLIYHAYGATGTFTATTTLTCTALSTIAASATFQVVVS